MARIHWRAEAWPAAGITATGLFFVGYQLANPGGPGIGGISSTTLPFAMAVMLAALGAMLLLLALFARRPDAPPPDMVDRQERRAWRLPALLIWSILFIASMPWLGYLLSGAAYLGGAALLFGNRRPVIILVMMAAAPFLISFFFERAMVIYLPAARLTLW